MNSVPADPGVLLDPPPGAWRALLDSAVRARQADAERRARAQQFRRETGLPVDRPVVMTGHQALWWHAGILAKYLACDAATRALAAAPAWLVVDQALPEYHEIALPSRRADGVLERVVLKLATPPHAEAASGCCPAFDPAAMPANLSVSDALRSRVDQALARLRAHRGEASAARQTALAVGEALRELGCEAPMVFASELGRTTLMREWVERMRLDPGACARAYNDAVSRFPDADLGALRTEGARTELPMWRLRPGKPRQRVFSDELAAIEPGELAPRAILMTGLVRAAACDLFIHGRGGGNYDPAAEAWLRDWLGIELAPMVVASADVRMDFDGATPGEADAARAAWRAHAALHDPRVVGDSAAHHAKMKALGAVRAARTAGRDAAAAYREMHRVLAAYRSARAPEIDLVHVEAERVKAAWRSREVRDDRAWAFVLHEPGVLRGLKGKIEGLLGAG